MECIVALVDLDNVTINRHTHTGERLYKCEVCDAAFSLSYDRKKHMHTHTGEAAI